jgi:hypothetical protein
LSRVPDGEAARNALISLRAELEDALKSMRTSPPDTRHATILAAEMNEVFTIASWAAGASLELARWAEPQATWSELHDEVGVPFQTLHNRLAAWRKRERAER